ncbi:Peptidase M29 aminopeptidase II [Elusimicrobium minutum Pei191]|uniref:Peptidase M29 aminopeptidase II n=1 Tax=Elusimicrobium minutum (strain Pei191) TaxID=445932 RepID=B2KDZ6_ELUMP|nr:aminopeptidase [Elusimicrobium minutum]ACC98742.1 Peptidase M29 aminopeptidase II [Elusimicrobium minutum Pei191]
MFNKNELKKYAEIMVWSLKKARTAQFKKYDSVLVRYDIASAPLAEEINRILLAERLNPVMQVLSSENITKDFYQISDDSQLKFMPKWQLEMQKGINGLIALRAPASLDHLKDVDPKKMSLTALARKPAKEILDKREAEGSFGWTLSTYPTQALAKKAGLSLKEYTNQIKKACYLTDANPLKTWEKIYKQMEEVTKWLESLKIDTINMQSKSMDLNVLLGEQRKFLSARGCNMPSFEIFTSPDWRGTEGVYFADMKSFRSGQIIENIKVEFKKGRVIKAKASKGDDYLKKMIAMDPGAAQIGEFSLTDKRFSKIDRFMADTLFDENFGGKNGNSHIALGASFADSFSGDVKKLTKAKKKALGFNDSSLHWDIINTEDKIVKAKVKNGKTVTIYEKGMFKY